MGELGKRVWDWTAWRGAHRVTRRAARLMLLIMLTGFGPPEHGEAGAIVQNDRPFRLPFSDGPGVSTWLLIQPYGNTAFAYRGRWSLYGGGQGLHFGVDFAARCGTPILAIGHGTVSEVDNPGHGAGPHNLTIDHPNQLASFYGHLLEKPTLDIGQAVVAGQPVALSGDPDETCTSRPHLHLEIRDAPSHRHAYNPMAFIDADWQRMILAGSSAAAFEQDLAKPRQWQTLFQQPDVTFGGPRLNDYDLPWPPSW